MGIQGLLPLLKDIQVKTSVSNFKGQTVGIDAYCWLHKGAYACAQDLIMGKPTRAYIYYVMKRVNMLINYGVTPILVFDGGHLPAKAGKEKERRTRRKEYKEKGMAALREGKTTEAFESFQKACDISPEMASNVIEECYKLNVKCIVAPYEADAQLAYLMIQGITQFTISEDSDLLLYGCNKVLYKMSVDGDGVLIDMENLSRVRTVKLASFTVEQFRWMCMLSGCDYLPSIKGMGLIKAYKLLQRHKSIKQCIKAMKIERNLFVPPDYEENFRKAELVFKYQLVFNPIEKQAVSLNNVNKEIEAELLSKEDRDYAGTEITQTKAIEIALGNIDPISGRKIGSRTNFASGKIETKHQKSTSWTNTKTAATFPKKTKNIGAVTKLQQSSNDTTVVDLTPPDSQNVLQHSQDAKRSLTYLSPKSEAEKSLKRLRSELDVEDTTREDKFQKLYKEQNTISSRNSTVSSQHHHSVFSKRKLNKFKNPFRQNGETNTSPNTVVISRYFVNADSGSQSSLQLHSSMPLSEKEKSVEMSPRKCPPKSPVITKLIKSPTLTASESPRGANLNCSFIDYLDQTNCRSSSLEKKGLTLKPLLKLPQQLRIDKLCMSKENDGCNGIKKVNRDREPLSPVNLKVINKKEVVDFEVHDKRESGIYITDEKNENENILKICDSDSEMNHTVLCENSITEDDDDEVISSTITTNESLNERLNHLGENLPISDTVGHVVNTNSQEEITGFSSQESQDLSQKSKQKMKLGLSRNTCKGVGVSSFVVNKKSSTSQITTLLEKFKNTNSVPTNLRGTSVKVLYGETEKKDIIYLDEEVFPVLLHLKSTSSTTKINSSSSPKPVLSKKCKPIGLRRQNKTKSTSKSPSSDDGKKQTKLSFNKFVFKRKSISKFDNGNGDNDDDVVCLS